MTGCAAETTDDAAEQPPQPPTAEHGATPATSTDQAPAPSAPRGIEWHVVRPQPTPGDRDQCDPYGC